MSGAAETEPSRPRPLSGGLWTLFSWLRRDEHSSSDSLSSAGSDRTATSFAFLAPTHYSGAAPAPLPTPPPPTDSYRKRVRDRDLRRQHDRDITLHRKYGLYGYGYDAFTLPSGRRGAAVAAGDRCERDRRATSECPRAHVPGKRRAPPPPSAPATLTKRRARKRPAPLPPVDLSKENVANDAINIVDIEPMHRQPLLDKQPPQNHDNVMGCKPEKYSKKDAQTKETKDVKIRHEKCFLKQIFENKKRTSAIEPSPAKLLPNISELDKQAAEIIEKYRLKELTPCDALDKEFGKNESPGTSKQQTEAWICTRCLRKYSASVITCYYCLPLNKVNDSYKNSKVSNNCTQTKGDLDRIASRSSSGKIEDKEKLKEILKEMKDSLPKKPKNDFIIAKIHKNTSEIKTTEDYPNNVEAPTLRISNFSSTDRSTAQTSNSEASTSKFISQDTNILNKKALTTINSVLITQPVVIVHTGQSTVVANEKIANNEDLNKSLPINNNAAKNLTDSLNENVTQVEKIKSIIDPELLNDNILKTKYDLNTPLKISSLLNPIYVPKMVSTNTQTKLVMQTEPKDVKKMVKTPESSANSAHDVLNSAVTSTAHIKSTIFNPPTKNKQIIKSEQEKVKENKEKALNKKIDKADNMKAKNTEIKTNNSLVNNPPSNVDEPNKRKEMRIDQHARRRDLINQLEKSIAKGDELAAAEAAIKLAQLRLSCSVLSFSSQIVGETSPVPVVQQINVSTSDKDGKGKKVEEVIQKTSQTNLDPTEVAPAKQPAEKILIQIVHKQNDKEKLKLAVKENVTISTAKPTDLELFKLESGKNIKSNCDKKDVISQNSRTCEASTSKDVASIIEIDNDDIPILVWVEDKEATRGPVQLHVRRNAVMGDLRAQAEQSLGLAARMQRWIVGRTLCSDDNTPLVTLAGSELSAPFYLCLVESDTNNILKPHVELKLNEDPGNVYDELMKLEKQALVLNTEIFECGVCIEECPPSGGVILRECVHSFCKECLTEAVRHSEEPVVSCPAMGCRSVLQEREIRALVSPKDYEKWLARGLAAAESGTRNAFHCRTRDCTGWALCDPGVQRFPCPVCKCTNCVPCQAIHEGETCEQHRAKLQESAASSDANQTDEGTRALLNTLISRGEALECPECSAIITKKWGCDWVKCSACKTEICWVTKGRRWGPAGRGDTSGGCRCGVDGKRCHPSCGYCH